VQQRSPQVGDDLPLRSGHPVIIRLPLSRIAWQGELESVPMLTRREVV
jgi:hypothetical protein